VARWGLFDFAVSGESRFLGRIITRNAAAPGDYHLTHEIWIYEKTRAGFWLGMVFAFLAAISPPHRAGLGRLDATRATVMKKYSFAICFGLC